MKRIITSIVAVTLLLGSLSSVFAIGDGISKETPSLTTMNVSSQMGTEKVAQDLLIAWQKSQQKATNSVASQMSITTGAVTGTEIVDMLIGNKAAAAMMYRGTRVSEDVRFYVESTGKPSSFKIGENAAGEPLVVLVNKNAPEGVTNFAKFCQTDVAQAIVARHGIIPLLHKERL